MQVCVCVCVCVYMLLCAAWHCLPQWKEMWFVRGSCEFNRQIGSEAVRHCVTQHSHTEAAYQPKNWKTLKSINNLTIICLYVPDVQHRFIFNVYTEIKWNWSYTSVKMCCGFNSRAIIWEKFVRNWLTVGQLLWRELCSFKFSFQQSFKLTEPTTV